MKIPLEKIFVPYMEEFFTSQMPELVVDKAVEKAPFYVM